MYWHNWAISEFTCFGPSMSCYNWIINETEGTKCKIRQQDDDVPRDSTLSDRSEKRECNLQILIYFLVDHDLSDIPVFSVLHHYTIKVETYSLQSIYTVIIM